MGILGLPEAERHLALASRYLEEGKTLIEKNPVQASEKLYKAAEEAVKALAIGLDLEDILKTVDERGRWTVTELEKAVSRISKKLGDWFSAAWDRANYLHVWGFHEAKLDSDAVKERMPDIERMISETRRIIYGNND
ncbi:MAG: PaREP1 family protein [Thermofilum sp.]|nr:PaREP1 family protein [Thermofilum sp.]